MNDNIDNMYDTTDYTPTTPTPPVVHVQKNKILQEVEINGQKFFTINPVEFQALENNFRTLKHRLTIAEQLIRQLQTRLSQRDQLLRELKRELDTKVSHET